VQFYYIPGGTDPEKIQLSQALICSSKDHTCRHLALGFVQYWFPVARTDHPWSRARQLLSPKSRQAFAVKQFLDQRLLIVRSFARPANGPRFLCNFCKSIPKFPSKGISTRARIGRLRGDQSCMIRHRLSVPDFPTEIPISARAGMARTSTRRSRVSWSRHRQPSYRA